MAAAIINILMENCPQEENLAYNVNGFKINANNGVRNVITNI